MLGACFAYGEPVKVKGLNLVKALPGYDLVASTALAVSGAHHGALLQQEGEPRLPPGPNGPRYPATPGWQAIRTTG